MNVHEYANSILLQCFLTKSRNRSAGGRTPIVGFFRFLDLE